MSRHATCPVSGLAIDNPDLSLQIEYEGIWLYFCCPSCEDTFLREPDHYISGHRSFYFF
ncbi:YHS domain-containing protein [Gracilimonas tropica]|uniref:YHS domain-containing protein n=1 Tax=Gracilimonas tropica TaxID=454600 RepID=UPI000A06C507